MPKGIILFLSTLLSSGLLFAAEPGANKIKTNTTAFNNNLGASDTTVQSALDTIDNLSVGGASISDTAYGASWNGTTTIAPSKNAVYDKIETIGSASGVNEQISYFTGTNTIAGNSNMIFNATTNLTTLYNLTLTTQITTPSIISTGALGITPASGSNLNVNLAGAGDLAVNTNQLYVDTSLGNVGIGTTGPLVPLDVAGAIYGRSAGLTLRNSDDTSNKMRLLAETQLGFSDSINLHSNSRALVLSAEQGLGIQTYSGGWNEAMRITTGNLVGIGVISPTAVLHLKAGTATANTAPLKFNSGTLNSAAEAGAVEFLTDAYYGTITTGAARKTFAFLESPVFTTSIAIPQGASPTVDAVGEIAQDTTDDQLLYGATPRVLAYEQTRCLVIENLAAADDNYPAGMFNDAVTITGIGVHCDGTCTTAADIDLSDRAGNAMTHGAPTVSTTTGNTTFTAVTAANSLAAGEGLEFSVANAVSPETDEYLICITWTYDRQ